VYPESPKIKTPISAGGLTVSRSEPKVDCLQRLGWRIAVDIEQIAVIAVESGRTFALAQITMPDKDMVAQLKPESVGANRCSTAIARSLCVPGALKK